MFKVGDKVRLTGKAWEEFEPDKYNTVVTVKDYDGDLYFTDERGIEWYLYSNEEEDWSGTLVESDESLLFPDYTGSEGNVAPVLVEGGYTLPRVPETIANYHPHFIQVYVEAEGDKYGGRDVFSFSAKQDPFAFQWEKDEPLDHEKDPAWNLGDVVVSSITGVWGLRRVLDEIERRMEEEK